MPFARFFSKWHNAFKTERKCHEFCFQIVNFVSDIGGQLGLWAGFSVLSLLEIIELITLLFTLKRNQQKVNDEVQPTEKEDVANGEKRDSSGF